MVDEVKCLLQLFNMPKGLGQKQQLSGKSPSISLILAAKRRLVGKTPLKSVLIAPKRDYALK
ncbi:hypothetical protein R70331_08615 [Paenibacillus sp. FSL R7-0331]|nr:hypothetical protein R70331_08615 [Paenibacillus sp. FSL R7-0331]